MQVLRKENERVRGGFIWLWAPLNTVMNLRVAKNNVNSSSS
jgi:hypothetical protein